MSATNTGAREEREMRWQGPLFSFTVSGAMALALTACNSQPEQPMIVPPPGFNPKQATLFANTNAPPTSPCVFSGSGNSGYLCSHGYYPVYGYPNYYDRPAPGSTVELVTGSAGARSYSADSPEEARESVERGGFGEHGSHGGEGEGGHGGGEGGGHGGGE